MTDAFFYDDHKTCPTCQKLFYRPRKCSPESWRGRVNCSMPCARQANLGLSPAPRVKREPATPRRAEWRHLAECRYEDPELFFPIGTSGPAAVQIAEAKTVCHRCPVAGECLTQALETGVDGIWGGTSSEERAVLKRRQARQRKAVAS